LFHFSLLKSQINLYQNTINLYSFTPHSCF
jgi:hypothetical protein